MSMIPSKHENGLSVYHEVLSAAIGLSLALAFVPAVIFFTVLIIRAISYPYAGFAGFQIDFSGELMIASALTTIGFLAICGVFAMLLKLGNKERG